MRIGICDDEKRQRSQLRRTVERELQLKGMDYEILEFSSGEELMAGLKEKEPEILFLDIEMDGINGMDTARALRNQGRDMVIIFVTAYPDFVFQGYEVHALHYLLKPCQEEKIKEVLEMALQEKQVKTSQYYLVEQKSGTLRLPLKDVCYFKSDRKMVEAVLLDRRETFYAKLADVEEELPEYFVRIHNRYVVNLNHVTRVEGACCICAQEELPVSRAHKQKLSVAFARLVLG